MNTDKQSPQPTLSDREAGQSDSEKENIAWGAEQRRYFKNRIRAARYAAQEDAENFSQICFALEELGQYLNKKGHSLKNYQEEIGKLAKKSRLFFSNNEDDSWVFKKFNTLYEMVAWGRNDNMHTGSHARNVTHHAIELCIGLEDALMLPETRTTNGTQSNQGRADTNNESTKCRIIVSDLMATNPIWVEQWHQVAHVRKLMLMHSFSYIPAKINNEWSLISDKDLALYLIDKYSEPNNNNNTARLREPLLTAKNNGLRFIDNPLRTTPEEKISSIKEHFEDKSNPYPTLCLVIRGTPNSNPPTVPKEELVGVLTPFDFM